MAPVMLLRDPKRRQITDEDLKKADLWALGMKIFVLISPDFQYPYQNDVENQNIEASLFRDFLKNTYQNEEKPTMSKKYEECRLLHWSKLVCLYEVCTKFNPNERPSLSDKIFLESNRETSLQFTHMKISQSSAVEKYDSNYANQYLMSIPAKMQQIVAHSLPLKLQMTLSIHRKSYQKN